MRKIITAILGAALVAGLAGCSAQSTQQADSKYANIESELNFTERDMDASYDESAATVIDLSGSSAQVQGEGAQADGSKVSITAGGTYIVRGTLDNGTVDVNLPSDDSSAQIVLDGTNIHNDAGPALQVSKGDAVYLTLADGSENTLSDGTGYALEAGEDEAQAVLYTASDLTINGSGSLNVNGAYYHAISSQGAVIITGGNIDIESAEDGAFANGAIKIGGGDITINAGDDGLHSEYLLYVADGTVDVQQSEEGFEAERIYIYGGNSSIVSNDDGVNASQAEAEKEASESDAANEAPAVPEGNMGEPPARPDGEMSEPPADAPQMSDRQKPERPEGDGGKSPVEGQGMQQPGGPDSKQENAPDIDDAYLIRINGGTLTVNAGGDGLDSNGYIEINGGTVLVSGASSADDSGLDYEYGATVNGGDVVLVGAAGMAEDFTGGTQAHLMERLNGSAGSTVEVKDASGNVLVSYVAPKAFEAVTASAPSAASISVQ